MLQHIKDNLKEAHDALAALMENTETLQQIEKAGAVLAGALKIKDMFTHVVMVVLCVMRCISQKSYQDDSEKIGQH